MRVRVVVVARRVLIRMFVLFCVRILRLVLVVMSRWWVLWRGKRIRMSRVVVRMSGLCGSVLRLLCCCRNVIRLLTRIVLLRSWLGGRNSRSFMELRILFLPPRRKRSLLMVPIWRWRVGIVVRVRGRVVLVHTLLGLGRIWSSRFTLRVTLRMLCRIPWLMTCCVGYSPWVVLRSRIWWGRVTLLLSRWCRRRCLGVVFCLWWNRK